MSLPEQIVQGLNQFACLYNYVGIETTDDKIAPSAIEHHKLEKQLKIDFHTDKTWRKTAIFAIKPDGITKELLRAKTLSNPIDVSGMTIMRWAKEVLKNRRKALACAKDSASKYSNRTFPLGKTLADSHKFIMQRTFVKLNGQTGDNKSSGKGNDDAKDGSDNNKHGRE
jgi:hypothetical protein